MTIRTVSAEMTKNYFDVDTFLNQGAIELKRAERYRVFVSLILLDLSFVREMFGDQTREVMESIIDLARSHIRGSDMISSLNGSIALIFPETPRQGAEVTSRRLSEMIRQKLSEMLKRDIGEIIPLEIASYPDTAGARTLSEFLDELAAKRQN